MQEVSPQAIGSQDLCRAWVKSCFASLGGRSSRTLLIWTPLYSHILDLKLQEAIVLSFSFKLSNLTSWPPTKSLPLIVSNYIVLSYLPLFLSSFLPFIIQQLLPRIYNVSDIFLRIGEIMVNKTQFLFSLSLYIREWK